MSKMGSHDTFGSLKHKLWPKERVESQIDSQPLKVGNRTDFFMCKWHATYCWKALNEGYNFAFKPHLHRTSEVYTQNYGPPKS